MRIPTGFTGLELLAWMVLIRSEGWLAAEDEGKLTAAARLRLLLHWAGIPTGFPAELDVLRREAGTQDAPGAVAEVRNKLVHPPKQQLEWPSIDLMIEAWRIEMEFLELVILRLLKYDGEYVHRRHLHGAFIGSVDPVPWADTKRADDAEIE